MDIQTDILIKTLKMGVDPGDNSYMPSVIVVNGGHSINSLAELNIVNVKSHDSSVLLLSNLDKVYMWLKFNISILYHMNFQYYPIIEISITKCRNNGIDCKVHGLTVIGVKKQSYGELKTSVSFLANDWDLAQDAATAPAMIATSI